jgi:hypothetical protein
MAASRPGLRSFLVEAYIPASDLDDAAAAGMRLLDAAAELRAGGEAITFASGIVLVGDELALYMFRSTAAGTVERALASAGIGYDRIAESVPLNLRDWSATARTRRSAVSARGSGTRR